MAKLVIINGNPYTLNVQGDNPAWGEQLSSLIEALVDVANTTAGTGDLLLTSFSLSNNVVSPTNVTGMQFDPAQVRGSIIEYSLYRSTSTSEASECGTMLVTYSSMIDTWELARYAVGDGQIEFTINSAGQVQYTSSNMSGTGHVGLLKFRAKSFTQS